MDPPRANRGFLSEGLAAQLTRMPTFHFNLSGRTPFEDVEGQHLPSLIEAMQEAMGMAQELARNKRESESPPIKSLSPMSRVGKCFECPSRVLVRNLHSRQPGFSRAARNFAIRCFAPRRGVARRGEADCESRRVATTGAPAFRTFGGDA